MLGSPLFTLTIAKDTGVLPVCPTTTEYDHFGGSCVSMFDIFYFKWANILRGAQISVLEHLKLKSKGRTAIQRPHVMILCCFVLCTLKVQNRWLSNQRSYLKKKILFIFLKMFT